jgi:hypothetical protein
MSWLLFKTLRQLLNKFHRKIQQQKFWAPKVKENGAQLKL